MRSDQLDTVKRESTSSDKLYWLGNIAKTRIIGAILDHWGVHRDPLIFDYGCGDGGDWPAILKDHPGIKLVGYEPDRGSADRARERLNGMSATILSTDGLKRADFRANVIVSFSVLEHVYDKRHYLATAKRLLANDGIFYLNYDDGHFRNQLDLWRPSAWPTALREFIHNLTVVPLATLGVVSSFQRRVLRADIDALVRQMGFETRAVEYDNLLAFKELFKTLPPQRQLEFVRFWSVIEARLNECFLAEGSVSMGDSANLWREMASRTLTLVHKA